MEIERKRIETGYKKFGELCIGETFESKGNIYLKIDQVESTNSVNLSGNTLELFSYVSQVKPIAFKLVEV